MSKTDKQDFKSIFLGEYVEIICKQTILTEEGNVPLMLQGYILEIDNEFIYLGDSVLEINKVVKREDVSMIEISSPDKLFEDILNDFNPNEDEQQ